MVLCEEYREKVTSGEIRPRNRIERLQLIAGGEPSVESTQAAKRLLIKIRQNG